MDFGDDSSFATRRSSIEPKSAPGNLPVENMHYVTNHNYFHSLDRISRLSDCRLELNEAIAVLSRFSLRDILNNEVIVKMYQQKTTLETIKRWAHSGAQIDIEEIRNGLRRVEYYFVPKYVLKVSTPRYHTKPDCEFLKASFDNFETPPEIVNLGDEKVKEFQAFCDKEWPQYRDKPIDKFWAHVGAHFRVPIVPRQISYSSTGSMEIRDLSEAVLAEQIQSAAEHVRDFTRDNGLRGYLHAPPQKLYQFTKDEKKEPAKREAFLELLKLKKAIKMAVFNFHRIELEMLENLLSDELLEVLGFLPCKACCLVIAPPIQISFEN